jgi:hypothetical protein
VLERAHCVRNIRLARNDFYAHLSLNLRKRSGGKLIDAFPDDCDVYKEQTNEKFLQLFYSDPVRCPLDHSFEALLKLTCYEQKRYGFALQWGMLKSRIFQLRLAQHDTKYGRVPHCSYFYWDRSMIGDYTFALLNHLTGGISKQEMDVYESGSILACARSRRLLTLWCRVWR